MTQVDFYVAAEPGIAPWLTTCCRVVEKAWRGKHSVYVHAASQDIAQQLDDLLWSFRPNSFIPHRQAHEPLLASASVPDIVIGHQDAPAEHQDILVNLTNDSPSYHGRFARLLEILPGDETPKQLGRERYKYYRKRGYPLKYHQL